MGWIIGYLLVGVLIVSLAFFTEPKWKRRWYLSDRKHFIRTTILVIFIYPVFLIAAFKDVIKEMIKKENDDENIKYKN